MAYTVMACIITADVVTADIVMAYKVMAYTVMAYMVMAYTVMACCRRCAEGLAKQLLLTQEQGHLFVSGYDVSSVPCYVDKTNAHTHINAPSCGRASLLSAATV